MREGIRDLGAALAGDAKRLAAERADYAASVAKRMSTWRAGVQERLASSETPINVARMLHELNGVMPEDGILVADGGFAAHWAGLIYDTKRAGRGFVPDRGFASIGYGLPGAIGAALAGKGRPVVSLTGDGGFNMSLGDLETARRMGLSFAIVVFNNAASGYVKALQHHVRRALPAVRSAETNYARVAEAMGCAGIRVEDPRTSPRIKKAWRPRAFDRHRRGGDARPGAHAASRRQPRGPGQEGRPGRVTGAKR